MDSSKKMSQSANEPYVPKLTPFKWFEAIASGDSSQFFALEDYFVASNSESPATTTGGVESGAEKSASEKKELSYESLSSTSFVLSDSLDANELIRKLNVFIEENKKKKDDESNAATADQSASEKAPSPEEPIAHRHRRVI